MESIPITIRTDNNCVISDFDVSYQNCYKIIDIVITISNTHTFNPYTTFSTISYVQRYTELFTLTPILLQASIETGIKDYSVFIDENFIRITCHLDSMMFCHYACGSHTYVRVGVTFPVQCYNISVIGMKCFDDLTKTTKFSLTDERICLLSNLSMHIQTYNTISCTLKSELLHRHEHYEKNILVSESITPTDTVDYCFLMIKCGKCGTLCSCERKIKKIQICIGTRCENITGENANDVYAYALKHIFTNYHSFGQNYYILPFGSGKQMKIMDPFTGLPLGRCPNIRINISCDFMNGGDVIFAIFGVRNVLMVDSRNCMFKYI